MILTMNKRMTLDVLAGMVQGGFLELGRRMSGLEEQIKELTLRIDVLERRMDVIERNMDTIEMHMDGFDKRVDSIETRMENGFYNIIQELQQIKKLIKQVNTREQVAALEVRVDILEKKIGT